MQDREDIEAMMGVVPEDQMTGIRWGACLVSEAKLYYSRLPEVEEA